jgi:hypothetical protein
MGTDWFVRVDCPRPDKKAENPDKHIKLCSGCPYAIWDEPEPVAGFLNTMCGVRVGNVRVATELDEIATRLLGIECFSKHESSAAIKLSILEQVKSQILKLGWNLGGFSRKETLRHLDRLIEFCKRADAKGLKIWVWA